MQAVYRTYIIIIIIIIIVVVEALQPFVGQQNTE
jgi:hypothetical protein